MTKTAICRLDRNRTTQIHIPADRDSKNWMTFDFLSFFLNCLSMSGPKTAKIVLLRYLYECAKNIEGSGWHQTDTDQGLVGRVVDYIQTYQAQNVFIVSFYRA